MDCVCMPEIKELHDIDKVRKLTTKDIGNIFDIALDSCRTDNGPLMCIEAYTLLRQQQREKLTEKLYLIKILQDAITKELIRIDDEQASDYTDMQ